MASGVGLRRSNHKTAEQRRRDILKQAFECVRQALPNTEPTATKLDILSNGAPSSPYVFDEAHGGLTPGKTPPYPSLLRCAAHAYIVQLQRRIRTLEKEANLEPTVPPTSPPAFQLQSPLMTPLTTPLSTPLQKPIPSSLPAGPAATEGAPLAGASS